MSCGNDENVQLTFYVPCWVRELCHQISVIVKTINSNIIENACQSNAHNRIAVVVSPDSAHIVGSWHSMWIISILSFFFAIRCFVIDFPFKRCICIVDWYAINRNQIKSHAKSINTQQRQFKRCSAFNDNLIWLNLIWPRNRSCFLEC